MKKEDKKLIKNIKKTAKEQVEKVKEYVKDIDTKVSESKDFKRYSVEVKRMNTNALNLGAQLYGVLNQDELTLTYRVKDEYKVNEIIEIGSSMYQVSTIRTGLVLFPVNVDGEEHEIECRVAELKKIDKVE
ncbi:hypothetical protein [Peloplasma aerotolerans]|uniref:Transcription elongation factor GreA/GreB C-terminal domain-containing protein n=1 Tax=Peloplasma aerotolerans TaxID=3044389 RepID=A0AAW6U9J5_9MOLU|nr:hypothetical protein [Mariniplasma sp. M4Ah]MDI6452823.1 hypothetical protein [Mariniplasma sp. M4Ah]